jgi:hypothetical protein
LKSESASKSQSKSKSIENHLAALVFSAIARMGHVSHTCPQV